MLSIINKVKSNTKPLDNTKIIILYRYFSTILTSIFYIVIDKNNSFLTKGFVILCVIISAKIILHLYVKYINNTDFIKVVVIVETLGVTLILIPTGGLNSPYIWYALNTILISAYWLPVYYTIISLSLYLVLTLTLFNKLYIHNENFINFVINQSNLILSFVLITSVLLLLARSNKRLNKKSIELAEANKELKGLNKKSKESIEYIMSLYQAIHSLSNYHSKKKSIQLLIRYIKKISGSSHVVYLNLDNTEYIDWGDDTLEKHIIKEIQITLKESINTIVKSSKPIIINIDGLEYIFTSIKSIYKTYGILGIRNSEEKTGNYYRENIKQMKFLADLSSLIMEKVYLEEVNERLLIHQEQNRIANEIHDSVCQRLFAISCAIHSLQHKYNNISELEVMDMLKDIKKSSSIAMKELRTAIYKLSASKYNKNSFKEDILNYINDLCKLHNVIINLDIDSNHELIPIEYKRAIYRIICEASGNAIRHGKASKIDISLKYNMNSIYLRISDNGIGFDNKTIDSSNNGLGIKNIYNLTYSLSGEIDIASQIGKGTIVTITFKKIDVSKIV